MSTAERNPGHSTRRRRRRVRGACTGFVAALILLCAASPTLGASLWTITSSSDTTAQQGGTLDYVLSIEDVGSTSTDGSPYTLTVTLPPGLTGAAVDRGVTGMSCPGVAGASVIVCTGSALIAPAGPVALVVTANVAPTATGVLTASVTLSGGGMPTATTVDPVTIGPVPAFGVDAFDVSNTGDASGTPLTQAGGHPFESATTIDFNTYTDPNPAVGRLRTVEAPRDIAVDLPDGFVGDPTGVSQCSLAELTHTDSAGTTAPLCPATSQIGTALLKHSGSPGHAEINLLGPVPLYNMEPPPDEPARFAFIAGRTVVVVDAKPRPGDYGITAHLTDISEGLAAIGSTLTFWGVPSDPSHDWERSCPGQTPANEGGPSCTSGAPLHAFFRNPTSCTPPGQGLPTTLRMDSWQHPGAFVTDTVMSHEPPGYPFAPQDWGPQIGTTGCDRVPFDPGFSAQPIAGSRAAAPAGMAFDITLPQSDDPASIGESDLEKAVVTLPAGVRVSPSSADGLAGCTSAEIALDSESAPTCPDASKIGDASIDTPLLPVPVTGGIYLAQPFDNPFDALVAVYLVASAEGVVLKLPGQVSLDPSTGQITTTFDDNPQLPFTRVHLEFKSGPRAPLTMPNSCGPLTTTAELTGWNGRVVDTQSTFTLPANARGDPCPSTFSPGFSAGTASNAAGSTSSFLLQLTRNDEDQDLSGLTVHMPPGLTGKLANAILCSDAQAAAGTCPDGTKIGDVTVGAGAGTNPFYITSGRAYITGPYEGAPFGLSIVVPAVAGPFDLGDVVVRSALFVDKHDASLRVVTDPLPTILQGIPLDVRDVRVSIDKPDFIVNPTSCAVKSIDGVATSTAGATANVSDRFQAADCASLGFKPQMTLYVGGRGHDRTGDPSPFSTRITMPSGEANIRYVRVTLPDTINARLTVINDACTRAQFESDVAKCAHAQAGTAVAVTPLLRDPLRGKVYFVKNGHAIPDLFVALRGQVAFDLIGRITIPGGSKLATTFATAPDVPIRSFALRLFGDSRHGSVGAAANLCTAASKRATAALDFIGQNGKVLQLDKALRVRGCPKPKAKPKARRGRRG